jgi:hypothetical protein
MEKTWVDIDDAIYLATNSGHIADYRGRLANHSTKHFRIRTNPSDVLGVCSHHSAGVSQDPQAVARYHVGPNHISQTGCPGLCYNFVISQDVEPTSVILARDLREICWSQAVDTKGNQDWSGDENRHLLSILVMGDFNETNRLGRSGDPAMQQLQRWEWLTQWLSELFGFDGLGYFGHYHFGKIYCPGRVLRRRIESHRAQCQGFSSDQEWQEALLRWNPQCLPRFGADGVWGYESRRALAVFERENSHKTDGIQDPFTELLLMRNYPPNE